MATMRLKVTLSQQSLLQNEFLLSILASSFPLFCIILWLIRNTQLPTADAANYLSTAINGYHHFINGGFGEGLKSLYFNRGWRPILFPSLLVPFLWLAQGNLYIACNSIILVTSFVSIIYIYLIFRLQLNRISAVIATNLIGLLPLFQTQFLTMFAECAFFPCIMACLYHLIKCDYLRDIKHSLYFTLFITLGLLIRPVEAIMHLSLVLLAFIFLGWRQGIFSVKAIINIAGLSLITLFILSLGCAFLYLYLPVTDYASAHNEMTYLNAVIYMPICIFLLSFLAIILAKIGRVYRILASLKIENLLKQTLLIPSCTIILLSVLLWFLPFTLETFQWIYRTSIGDVASGVGPTRYPFWQSAYNYLFAEGSVVVGGITVTALAGIFFLKRQQILKTILSTTFIYLILMAPFSFLEVFYSAQATPRKLSIAFPVLLMSLLLLGLQYGRYWVVRISGIFALLILQFILLMILNLTSSYQKPLSWLNAMTGYLIPQPITVDPNPHNVVTKFLSAETKKYHLTNISTEVDPNYALPFDPFLLSTMVDAINQAYATSYPYFSSFSVDNPKMLSESHDGLLLSDKLDRMIISSHSVEQYTRLYQNEKNPSLKTYYEFLLYFSKQQLATINWNLGPCIIIKAMDGEAYQSCLLFSRNRIVNKDHFM